MPASYAQGIARRFARRQYRCAEVLVKWRRAC